MIVSDGELYPIHGGMEKSLANVLSLIDLDKFDVTLVIQGYKIHDLYFKKIQSSIKIICLTSSLVGRYIPKYKIRKPRFIYKFLRNLIGSRNFLNHVKHIKPDLILDYEGFFATKKALILKTKYHAKLLLWHHSNCENFITEFLNKFSKRFKRNLLSYIDGVIFPSTVAQNEFKQYLLNNKDYSNLLDNIFTVYNGLDYNEINTKTNIDNDFNSPYILMVSRYQDGVKDPETLIKAFKIILKDFSEYKLVLCGDGSDGSKNRAIKLVSELKICDNVIFIGYTDNPYPYMKGCKVFVLSSYREGLPIVVNEAMYLERPIIVSNIAGCMEAINNGKCGLSFITGDEFDLADKLRSVIAGNYDKTEMLSNQRYFISKFDNRKVVVELENLLYKILNK